MIFWFDHCANMDSFGVIPCLGKFNLRYFMIREPILNDPSGSRVANLCYHEKDSAHQGEKKLYNKKNDINDNS